MKMIELLKNKPIIINTDLDGLISGLILKKYLNCRVIGFSNSAEKFWLDEQSVGDFKDACFVDMYVANPDTLAIDQHIISVNEEHHNLLSQNPNKINPNLMNQRCFLPNNSYYNKYPFGTIHFIIALLEEAGIDLTDLNLQEVAQNLSFMDLILRSDDAMKTTIDSNYMQNASEWWEWLKNISNNGSVTTSFITYLSNTDVAYATNKKSEIGRSRKGAPFNCDRPDGGVREILDGTQINEGVKEYLKFIAGIANIELFDINADFKTYKGLAKRTSLTPQQQKELITSNSINGQDIFSYAFVRTSNREKNFSYTVKNK